MSRTDAIQKKRLLPGSECMTCLIKATMLADNGFVLQLFLPGSHCGGFHIPWCFYGIISGFPVQKKTESSSEAPEVGKDAAGGSVTIYQDSSLLRQSARTALPAPHFDRSKMLGISDGTPPFS
jgi:hypothetical protein